MTGGGERATPPRLRCFVAVPVPEAIAAALAPPARELAAKAERSGWSVAWTRPEGWHVTLLFLGDVDSDRLAEVERRIAVACRGIGPFTMAAVGVFTLPVAGRPRTVVAGIRDDGTLAKLAGSLARELAPSGLADEPGRRFVAHLTLGRIRRIAPPKVPATRRGRANALSSEVAEWLDARRDLAFGETRVVAVELLQSRLGPGGSTYAPLAVARLRGEATDPGESPEMHRNETGVR